MYFNGRINQRFKVWCSTAKEYAEVRDILEEEGYKIMTVPHKIPIGVYLGLEHDPHKAYYNFSAAMYDGRDSFAKISIDELRRLRLTNNQLNADINKLKSLMKEVFEFE